MAATSILAEHYHGEEPAPYQGNGTCYIEFGGGRVGKVDVDFLSGPAPTGTYSEASLEWAKEKVKYGSTRRKRWFRME